MKAIKTFFYTLWVIWTTAVTILGGIAWIVAMYMIWDREIVFRKKKGRKPRVHFQEGNE